jgi:hypothetical protein
LAEFIPRQDGSPLHHHRPWRELGLGFADDGSHEGERPMAIRWRLHRAIPGDFYPELAVAV